MSITFKEFINQNDPYRQAVNHMVDKLTQIQNSDYASRVQSTKKQGVIFIPKSDIDLNKILRGHDNSKVLLLKGRGIISDTPEGMTINTNKLKQQQNSELLKSHGWNQVKNSTNALIDGVTSRGKIPLSTSVTGLGS